MSYDIYLNDPITGEVIEFDGDHHMHGGTYQLGGTRRAWLNITYNYHPIFEKLFGELGIRKIYKMTGSNSLPILKEAASKLANDINDDYWKPTEGNAKRSLLYLIALAEMRPDGIWEGD